jgi:hypothetical protein
MYNISSSSSSMRALRAAPSLSRHSRLPCVRATMTLPPAPYSSRRFGSLHTRARGAPSSTDLHRRRRSCKVSFACAAHTRAVPERDRMRVCSVRCSTGLCLALASCFEPGVVSSSRFFTSCGYVRRVSIQKPHLHLHPPPCRAPPAGVPAQSFSSAWMGCASGDA